MSASTAIYQTLSFYINTELLVESPGRARLSSPIFHSYHKPSYIKGCHHMLKTIFWNVSFCGNIGKKTSRRNIYKPEMRTVGRGGPRPAPPHKNDQNCRQVAGQNKGPILKLFHNIYFELPLVVWNSAGYSWKSKEPMKSFKMSLKVCS